MVRVCKNQECRASDVHLICITMLENKKNCSRAIVLIEQRKMGFQVEDVILKL